MPGQDRRQLARAAASGQSQRVARGVYLPTHVWTALDARHRHIATVAATLAPRASAVVSHWSAAAFHDLPSVDPWPGEVHVIVEPKSGSGRRGPVVRHALPLDAADVIEIGGILVTSLARTVLDLACAASFMAAVVVADAALHVDRFGRSAARVTRLELEQTWERARPLKAHSRSRAVFAFAETRSESPLESVSRVTMRAIGCPQPALQVPHYDAAGFIGDVDFAWREHGVVGEADGDSKYLDPRLRAGRSADDVVIAEKERENRLRALPRTVVRWRWHEAMSPPLMRRKLAAAGLPLGKPWS